MSISYLLAPIPKWYIADLTGKPLGGGSMYTYRSLDKTQFKFVFQDPAGNFPWTDPILFDENGSQGPFYWEIDSLNPQETYYIEVYDAAGVLQWTLDGFAPPGSGGGSIITTALDLENLIVNNVFWRNIGATDNPISSLVTKLCPGGHAGLSDTASNAGPDILFIKNNLTATDQITFPKFTLGSTILNGDVTPVDYFNYSCTNTPSSETKKVVQFPITRSVQNLTNQDVTLSIWGRGNSGTTTLLLQWFQFFGDGSGASPAAITPIQTITLTSSWTRSIVTANVPDVSGMVLGGCGNDGLFLQIGMPLDASCNIDFTKPCVYLGTVAPDQDYHTYDMIDSWINTKRTGYVEQGFDASALPGYVIMNDGSIGNASSGATTRANIDTFPLYNLLYTNVIDTWAPVSGGRSGDAIADFTAGKTLTLTRVLGRALASSGSGSGLTSRVLGQYLGEETHTLITSEMPAHTHAPLAGATAFRVRVSSGGATDSTGSNNLNRYDATTGSTGGDGAHNNMQPTSFMNFFIKL